MVISDTPPLSDLLHKAGVNDEFFSPAAPAPPPEAAAYLRRSNPRLREIERSCAAVRGASPGAGVWDRAYIDREVPLLDFRGDCGYVWQRRDANTPINYIASAYYLQTGPAGWLLRHLREDGLFGAHRVVVDEELLVSRDLIDSVCEIAFINRLFDPSASPRTILDIGAGYGRLGHRLAEAYPEITAFCTDAIPESTFICEYYLRFRGASPRARAVPLGELAAVLQDHPVDLATNIHSFSECTCLAVEWWLRLLAEHAVPYVLIVPNAGLSGGTELVSSERGARGKDLVPIFGAHGYRRVVCEPKYANPELQRYAGVSPTWYHLFERAS